MLRHLCFYTSIFGIAFVLMLANPISSRAVDFEAFEFNDANGTALAGAANTGTSATGVWLEDVAMAPSDIRGGSYNIVKSSLLLEPNYFQMNNVTSGTVYLVARMSRWQFELFDPSELEDFRFGFMNDDDVDFGATVTAQMTVRRNSGGGVEITGDAIGDGSSNIPNAAPLSVMQTQPFTAVLELNKTSNTYKVFYKNGTNPTQVVGMGAVSPTRDGNSVRMAANNSFGAFNGNYPIDPAVEVVAIDRIAVSDTNPFNDFITLEIDRDNAAMTLRNTSGATISGIQSYSITSAAGALNPAGWSPGAATPTTSTNDELAATFAAPINLTNGQSLPLSTGVGAWLKGPFEDMQMVLNLTGGTRTVNVNFIDNGGLKYPNGDFDFNNAINSNDWLSFIADAETDIAGLSRALRYQAGDLDGDGANSIADFVAFKALYDAANGGSGAFEAMIAGLSVPEPSSIVLLGTAAMLLAVRRRRAVDSQKVRSFSNIASHDCSTVGDFIMPHLVRQCSFLFFVLAMVAANPSARAAILEDFPFSDSNDTPLDAAANVVNAANTWVLGGESWDPSVVTGGNFGITKNATNLATAHIDVANVTAGKVWLVAEMAGWNFSATASSPSEQVRFAFLDNDDAPPGGSTITAQMDIRRSVTGMQLVGIGALGTGATNIIGSYGLPLVQTNPFTMVLELDKDLDQYSVYYKDGNAPFASIGAPGLLGASTLNPPGDRAGNSIRFASTGAFNDASEFFNINRIYLTNTSPIIGPVDPTALTLEVKSNGQVAIRNDTNSPISFNSYRIGFNDPLTDDLSFAGWNSLSDQNLDPVMGGNDAGETWDEAGGSNDKVLAESFLLGSSTISNVMPNNSLALGSAFKPGGAYEELTFVYYDTALASIVTGDIDFQVVTGVDGDYNDDGTVNAADYVIWRKSVGLTSTLPNDPDVGTTVGNDQYATWRQHFGESSGDGAGGAEAVPEPSVLAMFANLALVAIAFFRGRRSNPL